MGVGDLAALGLACWQAGEIWRHGSLFAGRRAALEARDTAAAALLLCPFCLSPWLGWLLVGLLWTHPWTSWLVYGLAAARLANVGNDLTHTHCRTPRHTLTEEDDDPESWAEPWAGSAAADVR